METISVCLYYVCRNIKSYFSCIRCLQEQKGSIFNGVIYRVVQKDRFFFCEDCNL